MLAVHINFEPHARYPVLLVGKPFPRTPHQVEICQGCQAKVQEYAQGARAEILCRLCLRREDEGLLAPAEEEQVGLDRLATVLDTVSWKYWKPGEQPAQILDWMFLGDLKEATNFELLQQQNIRAVLNLINWWELSSRLPEVSDFTSLYSSHDVEFLEVDSEDRLFFNIVEKCWPPCEAFLQRCKAYGQRVLVNCKAGHNRSACMCVCWLVVHEGMTLMDAVEAIQCRRGTILSNHGFRLQLVRLALRYKRLGDVEFAQKWAGHVGRMPRSLVKPTSGTRLDSIIHQKRMTVQYDIKPEDENTASSVRTSLQTMRPRKLSLISEEVHNELNQRALKMELLACLYHRGKKFLEDYEYTSHPPTVIGSGFSGDVLLCRRRERAAVQQNKETFERCVKSFDLRRMSPEKLDKLKNEAVIYLSLEHPHIARLFDVYEDEEQVSLVMQFCSGGTLEHAIRTQGAFSESQFQEIAVPMLLAVNYIHRAGIVHRDIKPRNWVYEADGATIKLIDFGFSVKGFLGNEGCLQGCMGTLGYLAPEVVLAGLSTDNAYTDKCDIWSLGVVFLELLTGEPAFHRDAGQCDGYTEEVVLREIKEVTEETVEKMLEPLPKDAANLLRRMLHRDPLTRPSAAECLEDPYLATVRDRLKDPPRALPVRTILDRFRAHSAASRAARAWLLAVARSPTYLPWEEFMALRDTFKMFDAHGLNGSLKFQTFLEVIQKKSQDSPTRSYWASSLKNVREEEDRFMTAAACPHDSIRRLWRAVCGEQDSLSYCEFLAVLLPPIEDVFEDATATEPEDLSPLNPKEQWNPSKPISSYIVRLKRTSSSFWSTQTFDEHTKVRDAVAEMARTHHRWSLVRYADGTHKFFDYIDINHKLLETARSADQAARTLELLCEASVGSLANCSGNCSFVPATIDTPVREVFKLMAGRRPRGSSSQGTLRRVPLVDAEGKLVGIFAAPDFLNLALRYTGPTAVLKSLSAKVFDRRSTILQVSVQQDEPLLHALQNMKVADLTICPTTSRELSGDLGGVVASNVVSVADLKWIICSGRFDALGMSVCDFLTWRTEAESHSLDQILRLQRLRRFNVVSVHEGASLHTLALRLIASKLQRIFLASDEIARIVGIVSSRDILLQVLDQIV
ncbi:CPK1 [Symbiodinium pilosum]|uniref:CPK1 protein n=1 Tax=Symbiodinium pilosum TaxID=2952 RepID=A0A812T3G6_SYMPI|nr:CPK1 [Symbiodinium pilosum]